MGVIAQGALHHIDGRTCLVVDIRQHSTDSSNQDISGSTAGIRATTQSTILVDEHLLRKEMELGMTLNLANTFERNHWVRCSDVGLVFSGLARNSQASSSKTDSLARCMASSLVNQNVGVSPKSLSQR